MFILSTGFWGALTIFPTYFIGRNTFGKKAGIAAAFLLAISSAHLQRGVASNANHDAFSLFFAVTAFYFFMRALQDIPRDRKWVLDWKDKQEIKKGLTGFLSQNKRALLYAAMSGMAIGTIALTWKGYTYVMVLILVYYAFQLLYDNFKNKDSIGITACVFVAIGLAFLISAPYYFVGGYIDIPFGVNQWYDTPLLLFLFAIAVGIFFTITRDYPWLFVISIIIGGLAIFFILSTFLFPGAFEYIMSGAGYFTQTKLYETIAEAQAPPFSNLVLSLGPVTFFLAIAGIGLALWYLRKTWNAYFMFILIWATFAMYMAMSAARFIFISSPAFALIAGWVVALLVDKTNFVEIARRFRSFKGSFFRGITESIKIKHVLVVLFVVLMIILPNTMYAFDGGIPYERKQRYNTQINESLPNFLRPADYEGDDLWYLGAFGYSLDKPTDYWPAAWDWLSDQNNDRPAEERPAFLSWWDYGFEAMSEGKHPTVADNFQIGYRLAGNVLMAQNESEIISLLIVRLLEKPIREDRAFEGGIREILIEHIGEEKTNELEDVMRNPADYKEEVLSNPEKYHPRAEDIHRENVKYAKTMGLLSSESMNTLSELYREISLELDKKIEYLAADSRLFPFSARETGVFYAPAKLAGYRIDDSQGMRVPEDFYTFVYIGQDGMEYEDPDMLPPNVEIADYKIDYKPMFYNTTLYRIMVGYSGEDIGESQGIPSIDEDLQQQQPSPGWDLEHFRLAHRTAYYNPYPRDDVQNHTDAWRAVSLEEARRLEEETNGTLDMSGRSYLRQGVAFLQYYDGAIVSGKVTTEEGKPVENAKITMLDETYSPHNTARTDENGKYEVLSPPGETTMIVSTGGEGDTQTQTEEIMLDSHSFEVSLDQARRKKVDRNADGRWDYLIKKDFEVESSSVEGVLYSDIDGDGEYTPQNDTLVPGTVTLESNDTDEKIHFDTEEGHYNFTQIAPGRYSLRTDVKGSDTVDDLQINPGEELTENIKVSNGNLSLDISFDESIKEGMIELNAKEMNTGKDNILKIDEGEHTFDNLPLGRYKLSVETEGYSFVNGGIRFDLEEEEDVFEEVAVTIGNKINGITKLGSKTIANQRLSFVGITNEDFSEQVTSNQEGKFEVSLPEGRYRVYGTHNREGVKYVNIGTIDVPEENYYNAEFKETSNLKVKIQHQGKYLEDFDLKLRNENGGLLKVPIVEGELDIDLPSGNYEIYGWKDQDDYPLIIQRKLRISEDRTLTLYPEKGRRVSGNVFRDFGIDGELEENEGIFSNIEILYNNEKIFNTETDLSGQFDFVVPRNNCNLRINKDGFEDKIVTLEDYDKYNIQKDIGLMAKDVLVSGSISSEYPYERIKLRFDSLENKGTSEEMWTSDEDYQISLQPGSYELSVNYPLEEGESRRLQFNKTFKLEISEEEKEIPIELKEHIKVSGGIRDELGAVDADIYLQGKQNLTKSVSGEFELYLEKGSYSLKAVNKNESLSAQKGFEVDDPIHLDIELKEMVDFSAFVTFDGTPKDSIPLILENIESGYQQEIYSDENGETEISLTPGQYEIAVDHTTTEAVEDIEKKVRYYYTEFLDIDSSTMIEVRLDREFINATLAGELLKDGIGVGNKKIEFISMDSAAISESVTTTSDGRFDIELSSGKYTIYAGYKEKGTYSVMKEFEMGIEDIDVELTLTEGVILEGTTKLDGERTSTNIRFENREKRAEKEIKSEDGTYNIILPKGNYVITAETKRERYYGEITYRDIKDENIIYNQRLNFNLQKVKEYGIDVGDISTKTVEQGQKVSFVVPIRNTGNTIDEYRLSVRDPIWKTEFKPKQFTIYPDEEKEVTFTVQVGEDANVTHTPLRFYVSSLNSEVEEEKILPIEIEQVCGAELLDKIESKDFKDGTLNYHINLRNTGNARDSFEIRVLNKGALENNGWKVSIPTDKVEIDNGETEKVVISLKAISAKPNQNVRVEVGAVSVGDPTVGDTNQYRLDLPTMGGDIESLRLTGDEVFLEREGYRLDNWQWAIIIIIISTMCVYVARKERWI
ncbi:MAG: carboxypeptidase regulatory-like domain-containing protein [Thermoplasmatota archaeon]